MFPKQKEHEIPIISFFLLVIKKKFTFFFYAYSSHHHLLLLNPQPPIPYLSSVSLHPQPSPLTPITSPEFPIQKLLPSILCPPPNPLYGGGGTPPWRNYHHVSLHLHHNNLTAFHGSSGRFDYSDRPIPSSPFSWLIYTSPKALSHTMS